MNKIQNILPSSILHLFEHPSKRSVRTDWLIDYKTKSELSLSSLAVFFICVIICNGIHRRKDKSSVIIVPCHFRSLSLTPRWHPSASLEEYWCSLGVMSIRGSFMYDLPVVWWTTNNFEVLSDSDLWKCIRQIVH